MESGRRPRRDPDAADPFQLKRRRRPQCEHAVTPEALVSGRPGIVEQRRYPIEPSRPEI